MPHHSPEAPRPEPPSRPSLRPRRAPAGRWAPLLLLLLSLAVTVLAIAQSHRAVRSHQATAEGLLQDYAAFAAWSYRQHAATRLQTVFHAALEPAITAADRGRALPPAAALLDHQRANAPGTPCTPMPGAPYYFRLELAGGAPELAGAVPAAAVRRWLADTVRAYAATPAGKHVAVLNARVAGADHHLVYALVKGADGRQWAYGFALEPARYGPVFQRVLDEEALLPASVLRGRRGADLLSVRVEAPGVRPLFAAGSPDGWRLGRAEALGGSFGALVVRAAVRPAEAGSLIIGGLPRSRLPSLLGMLALSVALAAVAVGQLRREGELARLRSDFVSSVSHELRTPLAQVRLFLETLRLGRWSTEQQREWLLDNMERETTRLTALVDNVLHFSRAERGTHCGSREPVALPAYLDEVVRSFAPLAAARRVRFEVAAPAGLAASLDPAAFRQVLLNLLDNAVKYGPRGQTVRVTAAPAAGGRVRIAVEDEGPGVEPGERELIWEPFRRGRHTVGSVVVGSGIGLSVAREIVAWHGGTARVEEGAAGARFVLELPGSWSRAGELSGAAREAVA